MSNKDFVLQRICAYAGAEIDPESDQQVEAMLRSKFNVKLPQRRSLDDSLRSTISDHEIVSLILTYRELCNNSGVQS